MSYTYNTDSTLATKTDALGQLIQYTYDSWLISVGRSDGKVDTFTYDIR